MDKDKPVVDIEKIIELCRKAIADEPRNATAHHDLGVALFQKQDVDGALEHLSKAVEFAPKSVLSHYLLGIAFAEKAQLDDAIASWKLVLELDKPNKHKLNGMAHYFIGKTYGLKGMWDASHMELRRAKKLLPGHALVMNAMAEILLAKGDLAGAKEEWLAVANADPEDHRAAFNVCAIAIDTGDYELAVTYGLQVLKMGQDSGGLRFNLGIAYLRMGQYDDAIAELLKAVEYEPEDLNHRLILGEVYVAKGLIDEGVKQWEKAADMHPELAQPFYNIGLAYARNELLDQANEYWQKALAREPNYLPVYIAQGSTFAQAGRWKESLTAWLAALAIDPSADLVRTNAMAMHFRLKEYEAAVDLLAEASTVQPEQNMIVALCKLQTGAIEQAWVELAKLHEADPTIFQRQAALVRDVVDKKLLLAAPAVYVAVADALLALYSDEAFAESTKVDGHPLDRPENQSWWSKLLETLRK